MFSRISIWRPTLFTSIIYFVIGCLMLFMPGLVATYFLKVVGIVGLLYGAYTLLMYFKNDDDDNDRHLSDMIVAVIVLIISAALIIIPNEAIKLVIAVGGIFLILDGLMKIPSALNTLKYIKGSVTVISLSVGVPVFLGIIFMFLPLQTYEVIAMVFGAGLIIVSILDLVSLYYLNKLLKANK